MTNLISKDLTEDFWNDCTSNQTNSPLEKIFPYKNFSKTLGKNNYEEKLGNKPKYLINLYSSQYPHPNKKKNSTSITKSKNRTIENSNFSKVYKNHPLLHEKKLHSQDEKDIKIKQKNALLRCLGLYAYGIEVKKEKLLNDENNKKEKIKEEILHCTFKPKISEYSSTKKARFLTDAINKSKIKKNDKNTLNTEYKTSPLTTFDNGATKKDTNKRNKNSITQECDDKSEKSRECTFRPKIIRRNINKIFSQSKSLANEKDNEQFFTRLNKAREDYMTKKMKQISSKDESYNTMLTMFNNFTHKHQRNKKVRYSMNDYKNENGFNWENKRTLNVDHGVIQSLRNELLRIDLNDDK